MATEIKVPELGESVVEATVGEWLVQEGDSVNIGDVIVSLETDKVDVEVGAEAVGTISQITRQSGEDVAVGEVLGYIDGNGAGAAGSSDSDQSKKGQTSTDKPEPEPDKQAAAEAGEKVTPVAKRMAAEQGVNLAQVSGSGSGGKITKQDVTAHLDKQQAPAQPAPKTQPTPPQSQPATSGSVPSELAQLFGREEREERSRMSRRRRTIASRLVEAQQTAAMLTTFNEVDMSAVIDLRKRRQEAFVARHGVKVGFMSFFVKAAVGALKAFPRLNAELDGDEMVLKHYYDIGMAVGAEEGLVVPVLRDADRLSFAGIEKQIKAYAQKAQDGTLTLADLQGGTFTITNGGVFGSMLSTPILNPPQVGILGLHNIVQRPVAIDGEVAIRPIMYLALTYDHRIVDGREAVQFLVRVKELIEDPENLLLEG